VVSKILKENDIQYVKWDMNRPLTDNYSQWLGKNGKEMHHRYVLGLYKVCEALINGFPHIFFEGCASGGCRFDPAMLYYFPQIWTSDDSDAYMRTFIQYGTSICYPLSSQSCHVSVCPTHQCGRVTPFQSRSDIAHLGATGYELDTSKLTNEEIQEVIKQITAYKKMEDLVLHGDLYRLNNPFDGDMFAEMLVSKDKSKAHITLMNAFTIPNGKALRVYPKGLLEDAEYYIPELNITKKGSTLMGVGILVRNTWGDFQTVTYTLEQVKADEQEKQNEPFKRRKLPNFKGVTYSGTAFVKKTSR
jgi:alpha-galactosidase